MFLCGVSSGSSDLWKKVFSLGSVPRDLSTCRLGRSRRRSSGSWGWKCCGCKNPPTPWHYRRHALLWKDQEYTEEAVAVVFIGVGDSRVSLLKAPKLVFVMANAWHLQVLFFLLQSLPTPTFHYLTKLPCRWLWGQLLSLWLTCARTQLLKNFQWQLIIRAALCARILSSNWVVNRLNLMKTRSLAHGNHRRLDGSTMVAMHGILASHGIIPSSILSRYSRRIYVLELMAALIALVALHAQLSHYVVLGLTRQDLQLSPGVIDVIDILTFLYCFLPPSLRMGSLCSQIGRWD